MSFRFQVEQISLETKDPFRTARAGDHGWPSVIVSLEQEGLIGLGEGAPREFYDETSAGTARAATEWLEANSGQSLFELNPAALADLGRRSRAAQAAVDIALHDLQAQRQRIPLWRLLKRRYKLKPMGLPPSTFTIGLDELPVMLRKVEEARRFPILKIKLGRKGVRKTILAIRAATDAELRIDANTAWTVDRTRKLMPTLRKAGVTLVEQPLARTDYEGYRQLSETPDCLPIWADESCANLLDLDSLGTYVAGVNLKLSKCGGIFECVRLLREARSKGLGVMIGCFIETSIGMTAGAHFASFVDHADLDGAALLAADPFRGMTLDRGRMHLPKGAGLGVKPFSAGEVTAPIATR